MTLQPESPHFLALPRPAADALRALHASPRLLAHHLIVHQVAATLLVGIGRAWPDLQIDREAVLLGAATHDIGKTLHPQELTGPGRQHENDGPSLLEQRGFSAAHARFARTHAQWAFEDSPALEDLLVALADTIWQGKRNQRLEDAIVEQIALLCHEELWETFMKLDDILVAIAQDSDVWLAWLEQQDA